MASESVKIGISIALIVFGIVLMFSSLAARKSKAGFGSLLGVGAAVTAAGLVVAVVTWNTDPASSATNQVSAKGAELYNTPIVDSANLNVPNPITVVRTPSAMQDPPAKSALKQAGAPIAPVSSVTWSDTASAPLEHVLQFQKEEPSVTLNRQSPVGMPAHDPKTVPAIPKKLVRAGYESAYAPPLPPDENPVIQDFVTVVPPLTAGPVFYKPASKYPTLNELMEERRIFESRPDTPELQRHRRMGAMREAALSVPIHRQRDGYMVPLTDPFQTAPSTVQIQEAVAAATLGS
jgi:hypothetical protein